MDIQDKAMLIDLSIKQWTSSKLDTQATRTVSSVHGNDVDMGRYSKQLVSKTAVKELTRVKGAARTEHYKRTLPWNDNGQRLLSSAGYMDYADAMRDFERQWDGAVSDFCREYPSYVYDARLRLNGLYRDADYPSIDRIRDKFSFGFNVIPVPMGQDFRVDLGTAETNRIQSEIETRMRATLDNAMQDVWERMKDVVTRLIERLRAFDPYAATSAPCEECNGTGELNLVTCFACSGNGVITGVKVANPFRDSLIENIRDLLSLIPSLNITDNPHISAFAVRLDSELLAHNADTLRSSQWAREETLTNAEDILASMSDFI